MPMRACTSAPTLGRPPIGIDSDTMQDQDAPVQPSDAGQAVAEASDDAEARMRRALAQLGNGASPAPGRANIRVRHGNAINTAAPSHAAPRPRPRFAKDGDVPVVRVPSQARSSSEAGRELAEARAAREQAEQALADAQGTIGRLQDARTRLEQAAHAAQAGVAERDAAITDLRIELARVAGERDAALADTARAEAARQQAEAELAQDAAAHEPEPVRWWLDYLPSRRS